MNNSIKIGNDLKVFRVGLGTNRIQDNETSKTALEKAVSLGINFIDTASAYTNGQSEEVIGEVLAPYKNIVVATKGGMVAPDFHIDSRPETLRKQIENSLKKLKIQTLDLYFLHRVDPSVPLGKSVQFLKQMQDEGKIKYVGLSCVTISQIEEARNITQISAIENEYSLSSRESDDVIDYCEKENIVFVSYFPLHFQLSDVKTFAKLQEKYHATSEQLAIAWLLKRSKIMLPIPGSLNLRHLEQNVASANIELSDDDFRKISNSSIS